LTSIKCRKIPNAQLIEKAGEAKDRLDAMPGKISHTIKFITHWNLMEIFF
jgi:hypothetical protein